MNYKILCILINNYSNTKNSANMKRGKNCTFVAAKNEIYLGIFVRKTRNILAQFFISFENVTGHKHFVLLDNFFLYCLKRPKN